MDDGFREAIFDAPRTAGARFSRNQVPVNTESLSAKTQSDSDAEEEELGSISSLTDRFPDTHLNNDSAKDQVQSVEVDEASQVRRNIEEANLNYVREESSRAPSRDARLSQGENEVFSDDGYLNDNSVSDEEKESAGEVELGQGLRGSNEYTVNLNINRQKQNKEAEELFPINEARTDAFLLHFQRSTDESADLRFVKLVAGSLLRDYETLILVIDKQIFVKKRKRNINVETAARPIGRRRDAKPKDPEIASRFSRKTAQTAEIHNKRYIITYEYKDELFYAWSFVLSRIRDMVEIPWGVEGWSSNEEVHQRLINKEETITPYAAYVGFIMRTRTNKSIPFNRTGRNIDDRDNEENECVLDVMYAIHNHFHFLKQRLVDIYIQDT